MQVHDVMTTPVVAIPADFSLAAAICLWLGPGFAVLPVVDADEQLLGVLQADQLIHLDGQTAEHIQDVTAAEFMTTPAAVTSPYDATVDLAALMFTTGTYTVPVVECGRLVGIVTRGDVIRGYHRDDAALTDAVHERLGAHTISKSFGLSVSDGVVTITGTFNDVDGQLMTSTAQTVPGVTDVRLRPWRVQPDAS